MNISEKDYKWNYDLSECLYYSFENVPNVSNVRRSYSQYKNSTRKRGAMIKLCANYSLLLLYDRHLLTDIV